MGTALIRVKMMPGSPDTNLEAIEKKVKTLLEQNDVQTSKFETEPIAFGLEALFVTFMWPEEKELEPLEENLKKIEDVKSAEIVDMRRAL
jgi:translation elongation factor aEF-1 beta